MTWQQRTEQAAWPLFERLRHEGVVGITEGMLCHMPLPRPTPSSAHPPAAASAPPLRSPDACRSSEWQNCDVSRPVDGSAWSECEGCAAGCRTRRRIAAPTAAPCPGSHRRGVKNLRDVFRRNLVGHRAEKIPVVEG